MLSKCTGDSLALRVLFGDMADELFLASSWVILGKLEHLGFEFEVRDLEKAFIDLLKD